MNIAILMTCHNRRDKTLRCLESLEQQQASAGLATRTWLVDDGSTDGTASAVARLFPATSIVAGNGQLFWCGGMRLAWSQAAKVEPDAYVWLNDDVALESHALETLHALASANPHSIVVGSCACPDSGERTYGGLRRVGAHPGKLAVLAPGDEARRCDTFEGNIVWVPRSTYDKLGALRPYKHAMGDIDYGYRAGRAGIARLMAPGFLGRCAANRKDGTWEDARLPALERLRKLKNVKGLPARDWWMFCRSHGGVRAPLYFFGPYLRIAAQR